MRRTSGQGSPARPDTVANARKGQQEDNEKTSASEGAFWSCLSRGGQEKDKLRIQCSGARPRRTREGQDEDTRRTRGGQEKDKRSRGVKGSDKKRTRGGQEDKRRTREGQEKDKRRTDERSTSSGHSVQGRSQRRTREGPGRTRGGQDPDTEFRGAASLWPARLFSYDIVRENPNSTLFGTKGKRLSRAFDGYPFSWCLRISLVVGPGECPLPRLQGKAEVVDQGVAVSGHWI